MSGEYEQAFQESVSDPERFWGAAAEKVQWYRTYDRVLTSEKPPFYRWFEGGIVNSCYNALDYHVGNGLKNNIVLIYDSPVTKTVKRYTYGELRDLVAWVISYFKKRSARGTMYFRF
jgi:propionyl-CoA synthetase